MVTWGQLLIAMHVCVDRRWTEGGTDVDVH